MKIKMKRCLNCKTLVSNSSKQCTKCGCKQLERGSYTDESNKSILTNNQSNKSISQILCPTCSAWVTINNRCGECCFCGDEISVIINDDNTITVL